jgi:hypothetical protein
MGLVETTDYDIPIQTKGILQDLAFFFSTPPRNFPRMLRTTNLDCPMQLG